MQIFKVICVVFLLVTVIHSTFSAAVKGTGSCPNKFSVKSCLPKCLSDFECIGYKRCCPNVCNSLSCADISPVPTGNDPRNEGSKGVMCGNVRCQPNQKCVSEGSMKRPKCSY